MDLSTESPKEQQGHQGETIEKNLFPPYKIVKMIGRGAYGKVYKSYDTNNSKYVAIKDVTPNEQDRYSGILSTTLREVSILQKLKGQPGIVELIDLNFSNDNCHYLVFEFIDYDLRMLIDKKHFIKQGVPDEKLVKFVLYQIIKATYICHSRKIFHRDIKPGNIFITMENIVKLGDFGLSKSLGQPYYRQQTREVQTLWYRAPELLLGHQKYTPSMDMFSIGCVFSEMLTGKPLFTGQTEIEQIFKIFQYMGTPSDPMPQSKDHKAHTSLPTILNEESQEISITAYIPWESDVVWEGCSQMPHFSLKFPRFRGNWKKVDYKISPLGVELMNQLLSINPLKRISAKEALKHPYFDDLSTEELMKIK